MLRFNFWYAGCQLTLSFRGQVHAAAIGLLRWEVQCSRYLTLLDYLGLGFEQRGTGVIPTSH